MFSGGRGEKKIFWKTDAMFEFYGQFYLLLDPNWTSNTLWENPQLVVIWFSFKIKIFLPPLSSILANFFDLWFFLHIEFRSGVSTFLIRRSFTYLNFSFFREMIISTLFWNRGSNIFWRMNVETYIPRSKKEMRVFDSKEWWFCRNFLSSG